MRVECKCIESGFTPYFYQPGKLEGISYL